MKKRYQFIVDGKTYYKNVSPENEEKFLKKYSKYNPSLVSKTDEPGKSQGTSQSQNNQQQNTESKSEDGSSGLRNNRLFKALKATMLSTPIGRMMATTYIGAEAFGGVQRGVKDAFSEERKKEKEAWKDSEATYLANNPIETKSDKPLEYKVDENNKRLYYNPAQDKFEKEVDYNYDRSQGIRFKNDSYGKFMDDIAYGASSALAASQPGDYTAEFINLMQEGNIENMTLEDAKRIKELMEEQAARPKAAKTERWINTYNKEKNPILGFLRATAEDPATALEIGLTSIAGQVRANKSFELASLAQSVGGAQALYAIKTMKGAPGSRVMATAAYLRGVMSTLGGGVETTSKFGELLKEEFGGEIPSEKELVEFFEDTDKWRKFRNKAILKGATIAMVDNIGGGIVQSSVYKTAKTGRKLAAAGKGGFGESITGGGGEALSQVVIGEKIEGADVGLEILGQGGQATVDIGGALNPGKYVINKGRKNEEVVSFNKIEEILESATPEEIADMNIEIEGNDALSARVKQQEFKGKVMSTIDSRVVDQDVREEMYQLLVKKIDAQSKLNKNKKTADDLGLEVDQTLVDNLNEINEEITQLEANYTALTDKKAAADIEARSERIDERAFKGKLEFAKKHSSMYNLEYTEMTYDEILAEFGKDAADNSSGFVDPKTGRLIINIDVARNTKDITVGNHELLHGILRKALKDGDINIKLIDQLRLKLKDQFKLVDKVIQEEYANLTGEVTREQAKRYGLDINSLQFNDKGLATVSYMEANPDEYLTILSDLIYNENITIDQSTLQSLMQPITDLIRSISPFSKVRFGDADAVLDFLREYNKSIHKGTLSGRIQRGTGADTSTQLDDTSIKFKRIDAKPAVDKLAANPNTNKRYTKKEWDDGGANRAIEEIEKKRNIDGQVKGYLDDLIAAKYKVRPVPDKFVDDVLGSSFFINHVRSFNPEINDSLYGWINPQIRNKAASVFNKNEQGKLPKGTKTIEADARTTEGQERVQLEDTDTSFEKIDNEEINLRDKQTYQAKPEVRERRSTFRTEIGITRKGRIFREVKKALRTAESIVNPKKFLKTFEKTVSDSLFDFMKVYFPDTNSMIKYREAILESIPVTTLVQMQKQLPEKIFVKSYGRLTNKTQISDFVYGRNESGKNPGKKKLLTDDILDDTEISKAKRKAGVQVYERLKPTSTQWQNYLNATEKGKRQAATRSGTKGNNRIKILEESAKAIGRDATPENLTTDFLENYIQEKGLQDVLTVDQVREEINKTIDRPADLKFKRVNKQKANKTSTDFDNVVKFKTKELAKAIYSLYTSMGSKERINDKKFIQEAEEFLKRIKTTMPEFFEEIKIATTKSTRTTFSNVKFFNKIAGEYNKLIQKVIKRVMYSGTGKTLDRNIVTQSRNKKILINVGSAVREQEFLTGKNFAKYSNENKKKLISFIRKAKAHVDQFPKDIKFIASFIVDSQDNTDHIIRKGANIVALPIDKNTNVIYDQKVEQEHMLMASDVGKLILQAIKNNQVEELVLVLEEAYAQMALLESDNTLLQQSKLSSSITNEQESGFYTEIINRVLQGEIKGMKGLLSIVRYAMANINLNKYILIENGKTITENFGVDVENFNKLTPAQQERVIKIQNEGLIEYFKGNTTLEKVKADANATSRIKHKRTSSQIKNTYNAIEAFNKQAELIRKQNKEIQADLEKRGYQFSKGMSTFDFDETLIIDGENFVVATNPITNETEEISSGEWPTRGPELQALGYEFNFDDFVNVRGGVDGPLLQKMKNQIKKYGPENVFVLTARPQTADVAIHEWLKSKGVNIPFKNITGLAQSEGQAKADWMLEKFAEGYNDMYFVDDALPNVKAVKNVLEQLDIKSKVVQAKLKFKRIAPLDFNKILEQSKGIDGKRKFSAQEARAIGVKKGRLNFFVPPSAEDFKGLIYSFLGKGREGDAHAEFFKEKLFDPFAKGIRQWNVYKQSMSDDYQAIKKQFKSVGKILNKKVKGTVFTNDNAIRVYLWNKAGFEIPGIDEQQVQKLVNHIENNPELKAFAESLSTISKAPEGYIKPEGYWITQSIASDLANTVLKVGRAQFLSEWIENKNTIFSEENLNKIEAIYGDGFRDALENMLHRMETGRNRMTGKNKQVNMFMDWINGSVAATMFFNIRSAALQTISSINFINMSDNNLFKAAAAFANQPQFWKDFSFIFNSPMLKQRRAGLQIDVSASEITRAYNQGKSKPEAVLAYLLEIGFTPTQVADSFAIAMGGAPFYRNRVKRYIKEGMSEAKAKEQAFLDFQEIAEETQQSSRPDLISAQQAGVLGRIILAWQNTPMQMTRLMKKSLSDLVNRRRTAGYTQFQSDAGNISAFMYYGVVQNLIFGAMQTGLMFLLFGWDEDEERKKKLELRTANGALDTILRGTGIYGAGVSTLKNVLLKWKEERSKPGWKRDDWNIAQEAINLSPPIGSKMRKIMGAIRTEKWNKGVSKEIGFRIENPNLSIATNWIEGLTNIPVARVVNKLNNLEEAIDSNNSIWQRVAMASGWSKWSVGVKDAELEAAKEKAKETRKKEKKKETKTEEKKEGLKTVRCSGTNSSGKRCGLTTETNKKTWKCFHHAAFKDGMDRDGDGIKEYRCTAKTSSGKRCKNKTENKNKKCYAHQ